MKLLQLKHPLVFFLAGCAIAIVQSVEVIGRVKQAIWYHEKFKDFHRDESYFPITAGYEATFLFVIGMLVGAFLCVKGFKVCSAGPDRRFRWAFVVPLLSLIGFGLLWIGMICSPVVELRCR